MNVLQKAKKKEKIPDQRSEESKGKRENSQSKIGRKAKEECESKDAKDLCPEDEEKMEDSPVLGLLKEQKRAKLETKDDKGNGTKVVPSEALIKKAVRKRSSYIKANAEYAADFFNYL